MAKQNKPITKQEPKLPKVEPQNEINTEELIAKAVAEAIAKKELELKLEYEKLQAEKTVEFTKAETLKLTNIKSRRKFVPDEARVRIQQNIGGKFIISETRGSSYFIELNGYGDSTTMPFKDLKNFHGRYHSFLNTGKLLLVDVISDSDVALDDVIEDLNLQRIYNNEKSIRPDMIEYFLLEETSIHEFDTKIKNSTDILETIVEIAMVLFKRGQFTDNSKMNVLRQVLRNPELFTN
jgi:hypothetical protein